MSVLGGTEILARLESEQIFRLGSWEPDCVQEASYELRLANDFLVVSGKAYPERTPFPGPEISIEPGEIALLSTKELCDIPDDLVGRLGIKFALTRRGLSPLFGFQVDPLYGANVPDERLYWRVVNLGTEEIRIRHGDPVFTIEFHVMKGANPDRVLEKIQRRGPMKKRIDDEMLKRSQGRYPGFTDVVRHEVDRDVRDLRIKVETVQGGTIFVILFGVFIVAASLIGVALSILLPLLVRDTLESDIESAALIGALVLVAILVLALAGLGFYVLYRFLYRLFKK